MGQEVGTISMSQGVVVKEKRGSNDLELLDNIIASAMEQKAGQTLVTSVLLEVSPLL